MTAPPIPVDYYDLGVQHYLIGLHTPDRMGTSYPTLDRHAPADEARFIEGWQAAKAEREMLLVEVATFGQHRYD